MVCKSVLTKFAIPFTAVTTGSLLFTLKTAHAETLIDRGSILKNGSYTRDKIIERGGKINEFKDFFSQWDGIFDKLSGITTWLNNLPEHISHFSVDLLGYIYELISKIVLQTPLFIFNNSYLKNTSLTLAMISITVVTILTVFESIMQISKQKHTKFTDIMKRYPIAIGVTGFAPFLFETGFKFINRLSTAITQIGGAVVSNGISLTTVPTSFLDVMILLVFDGMLLGLLIPIMLQNGRRWFDLLSLAIMSPLALSCMIFDRHKHYYYRWLESIKKLSMVQLVYATFIMLIGVFIYGTRFIQGGFIEVFLIKGLLVLGGFWRMSNPPRIVKSMTDNGMDAVEMGMDSVGSMKKAYQTITLKNFKPLNMLKKQYGIKEKAKKDQLLKLRKLHGKRNVGGLK